MKTLTFYGCSDDTFGEYTTFKDDFDNCASGRPIEWLVDAPGGAVLVTGQYGETNACWSIKVTPYGGHELELPDWPMTIRKGSEDECSYSPTLEIQAPDEVTIRCLTAEEKDQ